MLSNHFVPTIAVVTLCFRPPACNGYIACTFVATTVNVSNRCYNSIVIGTKVKHN